MYDKNFYSGYQGASARSAARVLSVVFERLKPKTMIDVGCGIGTWLSEAEKLGVRSATGIDGDYVDPNQLLISPDRFHAEDLSRTFNLPTSLRPADSRFDLAMSVEVAEHLPESRATGFVESLTDLSDVVLFSAAIPSQGGTHHINEQWAPYWAKRFHHRGYALVDLIRPRCWNDPSVAYYYAQNAFLYVKKERLNEFPDLASMILPHDHWSLRSVHPTRWDQANDPKRVSLRLVLQAAPHAFYAAASRRVLRSLRRA